LISTYNYYFLYQRNIVKIGVKHHNPNHNPISELAYENLKDL